MSLSSINPLEGRTAKRVPLGRAAQAGVREQSQNRPGHDHHRACFSKASRFGSGTQEQGGSMSQRLLLAVPL